MFINKVPPSNTRSISTLSFIMAYGLSKKSGNIRKTMQNILLINRLYVCFEFSIKFYVSINDPLSVLPGNEQTLGYENTYLF